MNISKKIIGKEDYKIIRARFNKIKRIHSSYFSKRRLIFLKILNVFRVIGLVLLFAVIISTFVIALSALITHIFSEKDSETLLTISFTLFGAAVTAAFAVSIAIAISLHSSNEYFKQAESKLFFEMTLFPYFSNGLIAFYTFLYMASGLIYAVFSMYTNSILDLTVSLIMSIVLFCRFRAYSKKNRINRFHYFLKHSPYSKKLNKSNVIQDYIVMLDITGKNKNERNLKLLTTLVVERIKHIERFQIELQKMLDEEQSILLEQNIIEDLYIQQSKNVRTPIEFFALYLSISLYLSTLKKNGNSSLVKSHSKTILNLLLCLDNSIDRALAEISKFIVPIDDLPETSLFYLDFHKIIFTEYTDLTYSISLFLSALTMLFEEVERETKSLEADYGDKIKIISDKLDVLRQKNNTNIDSEYVLIKKMDKNSIVLQEKIKELSEKR